MCSSSVSVCPGGYYKHWQEGGCVVEVSSGRESSWEEFDETFMATKDRVAVYINQQGERASWVSKLRVEEASSNVQDLDEMSTFRSARECRCLSGYSGRLKANSSSLLDECAKCPEGIECQRAGTILSSTIIKPGFWRGASQTAIVHRCCNSGCKGGTHIYTPELLTGCLLRTCGCISPLGVESRELLGRDLMQGLSQVALLGPG